MKKILVFLVVIFTVFVVLGYANALPIVDQSNIDPTPGCGTCTSIYQYMDVAQTFTVGISGQLTTVSIYLNRRVDSTEDLFFDIRNTINGIPTEDDTSVLCNISVAPNLIP